MYVRLFLAALFACLVAAAPAHAAGTDADAKHAAAQVTKNPDAVRKIQEALNSKGYQVSVNGKWDHGTKGALKKFQHANGIKANGKLNNKTINALGLASDAEFSAFQTDQTENPKENPEPGSHYAPPSKEQGASSFDHSGAVQNQ